MELVLNLVNKQCFSKRTSLKDFLKRFIVNGLSYSNIQKHTSYSNILQFKIMLSVPEFLHITGNRKNLTPNHH